MDCDYRKLAGPSQGLPVEGVRREGRGTDLGQGRALTCLASKAEVTQAQRGEHGGSHGVCQRLRRTRPVCFSWPPAPFYTLWAVPPEAGCGRVTG